MASFQRTLDRCHSQAQSLEASIQAIWQGIFSARFRDVDADIRATVIRGIGDWIAMNPADFLTDHYLKYVAWALSDRVCAFSFDSSAVLVPVLPTLCPILGDVHGLRLSSAFACPPASTKKTYLLSK